jgi:hypothetical protein
MWKPSFRPGRREALRVCRSWKYAEHTAWLAVACSFSVSEVAARPTNTVFASWKCDAKYSVMCARIAEEVSLW